MAQGFEATEALYKGLKEEGFIVKLVHMPTNAEFELTSGRLCPSHGVLVSEAPTGKFSYALKALRAALHPACPVCRGPITQVGMWQVCGQCNRKL
jgi:hypothetical protein